MKTSFELKKERKAEKNLKIEQSKFVNKQGFQKKLKEVGTTEFDKYFEDKYKASKKEIEDFLRQHPEVR